MSTLDDEPEGTSMTEGEFREWLDGEISKLYYEIFEEMFPELGIRPEAKTKYTGLKGITPILELFDDVPYPVTWTPAEFNAMWESMTPLGRVCYVRNLLTQ